jgi:medium-chain acyl-[acyl-carrier-protein] hydrolase
MSPRSPEISRYLPATPDAPALLRLFCFPYAGGGASAFRLWGRILPPEVQVCPVQLPGRETRLSERAHTGLRPLVTELVEALGPWLDLPYAFFGHSLGALVAFELIRELRRQAVPQPARLFVSAARAPHLPLREPRIHDLPEAQFLAELCRRYGGMPAEVLRSPDLLRLLLPVLRGDLSVLETFEYQGDEPLACPVVAFGGLQDAHVTRDDLAHWRDETSSAFALQLFPGTHLYLRDNPEAAPRAVARYLTQHLIEIAGRPG